MEREKIVPYEGKEMNFWDLCVAIGHAIGQGFVWLGRILGRMVRLTYRYWWLVITLVVLAIAGAIYHTRQDNIRYRVNATALINGASMMQFEEAFQPLRSCCLLPEDAAIGSYLYNKRAQRFETFAVVDVHGDGTANYVDFKRKSNPKDTVNVQMQDRVNIQFCVQGYSIPLIPEIEQAVLDYLNSDEALQKSYAVYVENLREEVAFNHRQAVKLDSLTSNYYYGSALSANPLTSKDGGVYFNSDRKVRLFLKDIYAQHQHLQQGDYKLQLATAPVVLENHFTLDPKPVMSRNKCVLIFFLLSWIGSCVLAELIDKRKAICAWLKA